ncbi:uncharacterized protein GGS25DRAFT_501285 [Hypoxylon fragiforme]|uniref:uncharacterized protein n=1 Tax=Hypoxylon fragiforme TaxID=63214 RepID=UPI0020C62F7A|nr:uncharacterized protein GGS25DRAFT_501285 [Hypoxylon fragiforme]KAI2606440.1 hypothetical protein GGS25DRAFT_501285 [Hypoxylon fragiforme]
MESEEYIFRQCQFEGCDATILIRGPYCAQHTNGQSSIPTKNMASSAVPNQRQPSNNVQPLPKQNPAQPNGQSPTIAPQEDKFCEAITVKTSLLPQGHASEKKQLSDKRVARKTTSTTYSKSKQSPSSIHGPDIKASSDRAPVKDALSVGQRPVKRLRLFNDEFKSERVVHQASFTESSSHMSSRFQSVDAERRDIGFIEPSDFALRPNKGGSIPLETSFGLGKHDIKAHVSKFKPNHPPRNSKPHNTGTRTVIDLTGDDDLPQPQVRSSNNIHVDQNINTINNIGNSPKDSQITNHEVDSGFQSKGKSIDVHVSTNLGGSKDKEYPEGSNRNEQDRASKSSSSPIPRFIPKTHDINIAPRSEPAVLSPGSRFAQFDPGFLERSSRAAFQASLPKPDNGNAVSNNVPSAIASPRSTVPSETHNNNDIDEPTGPFSESSIETDRCVRVTIEAKSILGRHSTNGVSQETRANDLNVFPQSGFQRTATPTSQSQTIRTSSISKTPSVPAPQAIDPSASTPFSRAAEKAPEANTRTSQGTASVNGVEKTTNGVSTVASMVRGRSWKHLSPEERRQIWVAKHDPEKFDSYIYGKLNEPNQPGSALFGLPEWQQPPRKTRPATHFAYMDPRVQWTQPRPKKWYQNKQEDIRRRGTRKSNFGKAAARVAQRKLEEEDGYPPKVELPERVKNNPAWLAALDELDEMAQKYDALQRQRWRRSRNTRIWEALWKGKDNTPNIVDDDDKMDLDSPEAI